MSLAEVWQTFSWLITSAIAVGAVIVSFWVSVLRPLKKARDEELKKRHERDEAEEKARIAREAAVDAGLSLLAAGISKIETGVSDVRGTIDSINGTIIKHDAAIYGKDGINDQISFLRGRESARTDIAQAASIAAAIVKETAASAAAALVSNLGDPQT